MSTELISRALVFEQSALKKQTIHGLSYNAIELVKERTIPTFCYDNALYAAKKLNGKAVVYGAALIDNVLPVEHCWFLGADGRHYDPTYQVLDISCEYFSLFELGLDEYMALAEKDRGELSKLVALDFLAFRRNPDFQHLFQRAA